jgi:DNA polymerase I
MRYQFVTGHYNDDGSITVYARSEERKREVFKVVGFRPYFYVPEGERVPDHPRILRVERGFESIYGDRLKKVAVRDPTDVKELRERFSRHFEADIDFIRRFLIDTGIRSGFETERTGVVDYRELRPVDFSLDPLECFIDVECYAGRERVPNPENPINRITCVTVWDSKRRKYLTLLLDDEERVERPERDWILYHAPSELKLIYALREYLERIQPDVCSAWTEFDFNYLRARTRHLRISFDCFKTMCLFDLAAGYEKLYKRGSNRLRDVAYEEGLTTEVEPEVDYAEMWEKDRDGLAQRNRRHVQWMVELNRKKANGDLVGQFWHFKNLAGLEDMSVTLYNSVLVDTMLLRKYHGKLVLPSKPREEIEESKLGGLVGQPPKGIFENVVVYDVSRYYPNLIMGILANRGERWRPVVELCEELLRERDRYDELLTKLPVDSEEYHSTKMLRDAVKYVTESVIGYFGSERSRLYNKEIFEAVTSSGREGILRMERTARELGYRVLAYDTDGIFIQVPNLDEIEALRGRLNQALNQFCEEKGIRARLKIKVDRVFRRVLFIGVKKRYAGWVVREGDKEADYLHIKGFEYVRRDASPLTRRIQRDVFEIILRKGGEGLAEYLRKVIDDMLRGRYSLREIAIPKKINKPFEAYKVKPDFVRGALYAIRYLKADIRPGDQVRMIYVKRVPGYPATDVICFTDESILPKGLEIDWKKMVDRVVRMKVEDLLDAIGLSWKEVESRGCLAKPLTRRL